MREICAAKITSEKIPKSTATQPYSLAWRNFRLWFLDVGVERLTWVLRSIVPKYPTFGRATVVEVSRSPVQNR